MNLKDLYINYFIEKGHKQIPSAPVVPENDPSVLFNTAGMQPLIPYLLGKEHPYGTRLVDYQKCLRTVDLDIVGDPTHHTFFEMLGNWSLGDYFKEESINYSFEFLTRVLKIPLERLAVTVFFGNKDIPRDDISANVWRNLGIKNERIAFLDVEDNFWIAGETGPCGPDTEIFYWRSNEPIPQEFDPNDSRWVEIWNNVFMEYNKDENGLYTELPKKNVDTGMGVERTTAILEGTTDNYTTSIWSTVIVKISEITNLPYEGNEASMRIIADHLRTSVFVLADPAGIKPSNTDQGYVLRRLIRRAIRHAKALNIDINTEWDTEIAQIIINQYENYYSEIKSNSAIVIEELTKEKNKFAHTLEKGLKEFERLIRNILDNQFPDPNDNTKQEIQTAMSESIAFANKYPEAFKDMAKAMNIDAINAFKLYDTFGFPIELTEELAKEKGFTVDIEGFKQKFKEHQEKSRAGAENKFKGGLAATGEMEIRYHTTTHLLNAALKRTVSEDVHQRGSNITAERLRFDFNCDHKLTPEELQATEDLVNEWIKDELNVTATDMPKTEAVASGAECMFIEKYPDQVTVYSIGEISKELCGGPHVGNTKELGKFKIIKEEASSAGIRRIKAVLE